jgi:ABC-type transport system involved in cytochrome c biogenesis permease subunit
LVIAKLSILCFAGTYALALVMELARLFVQSKLRWYATAGLMLLGWLVQTAFLANLVITNPKVPLTTPFESVIVLSWIVAFVGLYLIVRSPKQVAVGVFVLPLVIGLIVIAGWFSPRQSDWVEWGGTVAFWGTVHGIFLLAGAVFTCVAFFAGLMYLVQMDRLKAKRLPMIGFSLPSLEQSERINRGAITIAFPLLTCGLLIGMVLSIAARHDGGALGVVHPLRWSDPKVLSAVLMWLVFAVLLHARFRPAMRGKSVMLLTIVAFGFLVFTWVGVEALRLPSAHGSGKTLSFQRLKTP